MLCLCLDKITQAMCNDFTSEIIIIVRLSNHQALMARRSMTILPGFPPWCLVQCIFIRWEYLHEYLMTHTIQGPISRYEISTQCCIHTSVKRVIILTIEVGILHIMVSTPTRLDIACSTMIFMMQDMFIIKCSECQNICRPQFLRSAYLGDTFMIKS